MVRGDRPGEAGAPAKRRREGALAAASCPRPRRQRRRSDCPRLPPGPRDRQRAPEAPRRRRPCAGAQHEGRAAAPRAEAQAVIRWEQPGYVVAFTTREGGVSTGVYESLNLTTGTGDDPELVAENRRRACAK